MTGSGDPLPGSVPTRRERRRQRRAARSLARRVVRGVVAAAGALVAVVLILAASAVAVVHHQGVRTPAGDSQYVALGSSFAAGPGVGTRAPDSPTLCARSAENYAHRLAAARHLDLTDVTCSGATAENVLHGGQYFQPPQVSALRSTTELVTVTVGGNDLSYLGNLWAASCHSDPGRAPFVWRTLGCTATDDAKVDAALAKLPDQLRQIAEGVEQRSPHARLVFVDYTTVLPDSGACPGRLPVPTRVLDRSRQVAEQLRTITAAVAQESGALLLPASTITHGHDVCAPDPWVDGYTFPRSPATYGPVPYHPTASAMAAIADALDRALPV